MGFLIRRYYTTSDYLVLSYLTLYNHAIIEGAEGIQNA